MLKIKINFKHLFVEVIYLIVFLKYLINLINCVTRPQLKYYYDYNTT